MNVVSSCICRRGRSRSETVCRLSPSTRFHVQRSPVTSSEPELRRVTWPPPPRSRSRSRWRAEPTAAAANCRRRWRAPAKNYEYSYHHDNMLATWVLTLLLIRLSSARNALLRISLFVISAWLQCFRCVLTWSLKRPWARGHWRRADGEGRDEMSPTPIFWAVGKLFFVR